jgi:serine/threonine protein kinase
MVAVMRSQTQDLTREAELMMQIAKQSPHPHVMKLIATEYDAWSRVSMVAPIASFGSMLDLADHLEFEGFEVGAAHKQQAFAQALSAVLHLNSIAVDHGDVAARNLLVFRYDPRLPRETDVRLCDFGDAREGCTAGSALRGLACELSRL